jgi:hypothetical protein
VTSVYYEIRVTGILRQRRCSTSNGSRSLWGVSKLLCTVRARDQAALSGLLAMLAASGIEIVVLRRFPWFEPASCERAIPDVMAADPPTVRFPAAA